MCLLLLFPHDAPMAPGLGSLLRPAGSGFAESWAPYWVSTDRWVLPQIYEVVRPLVSLLHLNCSGLQNFEALMALTNLAGMSERLR